MSYYCILMNEIYFVIEYCPRFISIKVKAAIINW